jgi:autotransporter-associated beta strand protein
MRLRPILFVAAMLMVAVAAQASVNTSYTLSATPTTATLSGTQSNLDSISLSGSGTLNIVGSNSPVLNFTGNSQTVMSINSGQTVNFSGNVNLVAPDNGGYYSNWSDTLDVFGTYSGTSTFDAGGGSVLFDGGATLSGTHTFTAAYFVVDGSNTTLSGTNNVNIYTGYGNGDEGFYIGDNYNWDSGYSSTVYSAGGTINLNGGAVYVQAGVFAGNSQVTGGDVWVAQRGTISGAHTINGNLWLTVNSSNAPNVVNEGWYWGNSGYAYPMYLAPSDTPGTLKTMTVTSGHTVQLDSPTVLTFQVNNSGSDVLDATGCTVLLGSNTSTPTLLTTNISMIGLLSVAPGNSVQYPLIKYGTLNSGGGLTLAPGTFGSGTIYNYSFVNTGTAIDLQIARTTASTLWTGAADTNFTNPSNWDNGAPTSALNAGVDLPGSNTLAVNSAATMASFALGGIGNWTINGGGSLSAGQMSFGSTGTTTVNVPLSGALSVSAGTVNIDGGLSGGLAVTGNTVLNLNSPLSGSGGITVNSTAYPALAVTGQQNYLGTTTINGGYVTVNGNTGDTSDLGAGTITLDNLTGSAYLTLTNATIGAGTAGSELYVESGYNVQGSGTINRSVEWKYAPYLIVTGSGLTINASPGATNALTIDSSGQLFEEGSGPLTINGNVWANANAQVTIYGNTTINGNFSSAVGSSLNLSTGGTLTVSGLTTANLSGAGTLNASGGLILPIANISFDPNAYQSNGWPNNNPGSPKSTVTNTLNVAGTFGIQNGWMTLANESQIPSSVTNLALGGPGSTGGIWVDSQGSSSSPITQSITLSGEGGVFTVNSWTGCGWTGCGAANTPFDGVISGTGNLFLLAGYAQTFEGTANNTYTGNTYVLGWANVLTSARALNGNVTVAPGENLSLTSANNLDPTKAVTVGSIQFASPQMDFMGGVGVLTDFVPNISSSSSGALTLESNLPNQNYSSGLTGPAVNAALAVGSAPLGNGYMYLSGPNVQGGQNGWGEVFTGASLQPDVDNVYRFWLNNSGFTLANNNDWLGASGVLADVNGVSESVLISAGPNWGNTWLSTNDANNFSGSLTLNANSFLSGWVLSTGSPFGAAAGNVYLNGGGLGLNSWNTAPAVVAKNALYFQGQNLLSFNPQDPNQKTLMSFNSINRVNNGILGLYVNSVGTLGGNVQLTVTTPPANTNGMVAPWILDYYGASFMQYNSTTGFAPATFTATDSFGANNGTDIVSLTNTTGTNIPSGTNVYALRTAGALTGGDVTIGSGGLILAGAPSSPGNGWGGPAASNGAPITLVSTTNINFGSSEGVIYSTGHDPSKINYWYTGWNELDGTISGTGGLTIGSPLNGNGTPYIYIGGNNTGLSGQVTIDQSIVKICNTVLNNGNQYNGISNALGTGTIFINGGTGNNGNCAMGALSPYYNTGQDGVGNSSNGYNGTTTNNIWNGTTVTLNNPIAIGPNGGTFLLENWSNFQLNGQVSGTGTMGVTGGGTVYLTNANNNWTGGTYLSGGLLQVNAGSKIGPGPVLITGSGALVLYSTTGTNNTNDISMYNTWSYGDGGLTEYSQVGNPNSTNDPLYGTMDNQLAVGASATIGTLSGTGNVMLGYNVGWQSQPVTLTFGNAESSDFYGMFENYQQVSWSNSYTTGGNLVYAGTGDFTYWGQDMRSTSGYGSYFSATTTIQSGTFTNNGTLAGTGVTVTGGTLNGSGAIKAPVTVTSAGTLGGALTVTGNVTSVGTINAGGVINGNLAANAGTVAGTTAVNGNFTIGTTGGAATTVTGMHAVSGNVTLNNGSFTADPGTTIGGTLSVSGTSTYAGSSAITGAVTNAGTISGTHTIAGNYTQTAGSLSGTSTFGTTLAPVAVTINAGSFSGNNIVNGSFTTSANSNAVVATHNGLAAGTLTINGAVTLDHSTTLNFNLGPAGTTGSNDNDFINIAGPLSLDGTLNVNALGSFGVGTYTLIDYSGALSGAGLTLGTTPGLGFNYAIDTSMANEINLDVTTQYAPGDTNHDGFLNSLDIDWIYQNLTVAPATYIGTWPRPLMPYNKWCDVNGDGVVSVLDVTYELNHYFHTSYGDANLDRATDFGDFQTLLNHWQASGAAIGWAQADFNGDGVVDFLDFQILLNYWNPGGWNYAPSQTPEPASLSLILLGGLALLRRKK